MVKQVNQKETTGNEYEGQLSNVHMAGFGSDSEAFGGDRVPAGQEGPAVPVPRGCLTIPRCTGGYLMGAAAANVGWDLSSCAAPERALGSDGGSRR